jgi:hypothetical protein
MKDLTADDTVNLLQDCRLMRKDELQVSDCVCPKSVVETFFLKRWTLKTEVFISILLRRETVSGQKFYYCTLFLHFCMKGLVSKKKGSG